MMEKEQEKEMTEGVVEAKCVYMLMKDQYRISRNTRASWYLQNLNCFLKFSQKKSLNDFENELEVLSITSANHRGQPITEDSHRKLSYLLTPNTLVTFLARKYRLVFVLDLSPSVGGVVPKSDTVLYEEVFNSLACTLRGLTRPFCTPGGSLVFAPQLYITVIAHTPLINCKANQVLLQGALIKEDNVDSVLDQLKRQISEFENSVAESMENVVEKDFFDDDDEPRLTGGLFEDIVELPDAPDPQIFLMSPEISFINMLRYGLLALQLLPENSAGGIIVITDGIIGLPDASIFESLMIQLRHSTVACSFIQLGGTYHPNGGLGQLPYHDLMATIAMATFGAYFPKLPELGPYEDKSMNVFHNAILAWSFQKAIGPDQGTLDNGLSVSPSEDILLGLQRQQALPNDIWCAPLMKKKHTERSVATRISVLISCRLREGYTIKQVKLTKTPKGEGQIEVLLVLPWRQHAKIHYHVSSSWPPAVQQRKNCRVEVTIEANYEFLHDVTCTMKKQVKSPYRTALVKRYWMALQGMSETDELLVHLQSFSSNAIYYKVPDNLKRGIPLFYVAPNSTNYHLNIQLNAKDQILNQFSTFWKPVLMLDINIWQKWMHTHRIGFLLGHDIPLGKYLHIPNSSGRFHPVTCRQAVTALNVLLADWSTFILMENHSYIKLIFEDPEQPPVSFYIMRLTSKPPCMVLRLAFLGGTPGQLRHEEYTQLLDRIVAMKFPQRGTQKEEKSQTSQTQQKQEDKAGEVHIPPLQRKWSEVPCCVLTRKPIEKILIRYERMPHDFMKLELPPVVDQNGHFVQVSTANKAASSLYMTLSKYLYHKRWVWSVQSSTNMPMSIQAVGRILSNITKIRLQEGFNFAHANRGIVNMALEVELKRSDIATDYESDDFPQSHKKQEDVIPCVVQYIIFPPHTTTVRGSVSEDDTEEVETTEADGEMQIITECWVEPQNGVVVNSSPERQPYEGLTHKEIPSTMFPTDFECISTMVTFEHLNLMCQSAIVPSPTVIASTPSSQHSFHDVYNYPKVQPDLSIKHITFPFDLMGLLQKCQQVELLVSTFIQDTSKPIVLKSRSGTLIPQEEENEVNKSPSPNNLLFELFMEEMQNSHKRELYLTDTQCEQFVAQIKERDRDETRHPLPFLYPGMPSGDQEENITDMGAPEGSCMSLVTNFSYSSSQTGQSQNTTKTSTTQDSNVDPVKSNAPSQSQEPAISKQSVLDLSGSKTHTPMTEHDCTEDDQGVYYPRITPKWRCFVRSISSTHIVLSFIPASYEDLLLLIHENLPVIEVSEQDEVNAKPDTEKDTATELDTSETAEGQESVLATDKQAESVPEEKITDRERTPSGEENKNDSSGSNTAEEPKVGKSEILLDTAKNVDMSSSDSVDFKDNIEAAHTCGNLEKDEKSYVLPVFIYNCPLSALAEQLVNKWTFVRPEDVYHDLRFNVDSQDDTKPNTSLGTEEKVSESEKRSERRRYITGDGDSESLYGDNEDLLQHCTLLSEKYLRCFVSALYKSLQYGHEIICHDVDFAINRICEESLPLEIDITRYIQAVCGSVRQVIQRVTKERMFQEDQKILPETLADSEETPYGFLDETNLRYSMSSADSAHHKPKLIFPLELLRSGESCEAVKGLHDLIRKKFSDVMRPSFKVVPSNPDYQFYFSDENVAACDQVFEANPVNSSLDQTIHKSVTSGDESEIFMSDYEDNEEKKSIGDSVRKTSMTLSSEIEDMVEACQLDEDEDDVIKPLFIQLTCSIKYRQEYLKSIHVNNLPTCLGQMKSCLEGLGPEVDLNDLQITLDIICLTLPIDTDMEETRQRPCFNRLTSYTSQASNMSSSPTERWHDEENDSIPTTVDPITLGANGTKVLKNLPLFQRQAINTSKDQVQWLLRDEIASAMRLIIPVSQDTLEMVANHVKNSVGLDKPKCVRELVSLQFVFGPDQSITHFIEDFEKMKLDRYQLNKVGGYYFILDRFAVNLNPLDTLMYDQSPAASKDSPFGNKLTHLDSSYEAMGFTPPNTSKCTSIEDEGNVRDQQDKVVVSPQSGETEGDGELSPLVVRPGRFLGSGSFSDTADPEQMDSVEVIETCPMDLQIGENETTGSRVEEVFCAEDFRISVTRPSPIKEVPPGVKRDVAESLVIESLSKCSSESSILVIEDKEYEADKEDLDDRADSSQGQHEFEGRSSRDTSTDRADNSQGPHEFEGRSSRETSTDSSSKSDSTIISKGSDSTLSEFPLMKDESSMTIKDEAQAQASRTTVYSRSQSEISVKAGSSAREFVVSPVLSSTTKNEDVPSKRPHQQLSLDRQESVDNKWGMRRVHSSASFEKYKISHDKPLQKVGSTSSVSGATVLQRRPSDTQSGQGRSRHHSDFQTPLSSVDHMTSRSSFGDEAYDGDSSDSDNEGVMLSYSDSMIQKTGELPDFWLIMKIKQDQVEVYFHTRDTGMLEAENYVKQRELYDKIVANIRTICRIVNQRLLLADLWKTKMCNSLLVPEADEDVKWTLQDKSPHTKRKQDLSDDSEDETCGPQPRYLMASMQFMPGHFACKCVWKTHFPLHPKLKTGPGRSGVARAGIMSLRSVLSTFAVQNRKNMFVIQERTSGSVFYMRLDESMCELRSPGMNQPDYMTQRTEDESSFTGSRSSSMLSLARRGGVEADDESSSNIASPRRMSSSGFDKDFDSLSGSMNLKSSQSNKKVEESVTLSAYGISVVGEEIAKDLVQMLQKKLDDAVLEVVTVMLSRNPMCKLTAEDVQFIQKPFSEPSHVLNMNIPASAMLQQYALGYYLRQNLLGFLFTPKFQDTKTDVFKTFVMDVALPLPENDVFLYNRPAKSGGIGIALIHLHFVDGKGNPTQLIPSPKPSRFSYQDPLEASMFEGSVSSEQYVPSGGKGPGPMALVQFRTWVVGDIGMPNLNGLLKKAMKHSACDIIMEYRLLTAPLCEAPQHYERGLDSPMHSAPQSPRVIHGENPGECRSLPPVLKRQLMETGRTPKDRMLTFSLQSIMSDVFKKKTSGSGGSVGTGSGAKDFPCENSTMQDFESERRREIELRQKMQKYESGEKGFLHTQYYTTMIDWLEYCGVIGVPSITLCKGTLESRFCQLYLLKEFQSTVTNNAADVSVKAFKCLEPFGGDLDVVYVPFTPGRTPMAAKEGKSESSLDLNQYSPSSVMPGKSFSFILIGRNMEQWRASIDYDQNDEENAPPKFPSLTNSKTHKSYQKFQPQTSMSVSPQVSNDSKGSVSSASDSPVTPTVPVTKEFVPRQRFLLLKMDDKEVKLYIYNWAPELNNTIERQFKQLFQWHNARTHLLNCILSQKMGLFQHNKFSGLSSASDQESNPFTLSPGDIDLLVKHTSPPIYEIQKRSRSGSMVRRPPFSIHPAILPKLDEICRDAKPSNLYSHLRDPVHKHGAQLLELKSKERREVEKMKKLEDLYMMWQQRPSHVPIPEETLHLLKTSSRLIHNVATPILFSMAWRQKILGKPAPSRRQDSQNSDTKPRSRQSSGASIKSRRSETTESRRISLDSPDLAIKAMQEEAWHSDLRHSFVSQYHQYLASLGFTMVQTLQASPKRGVRSTRDKKKSEDFKSVLRPGYSYMQKTLPGGIMLIELGFSEVYFCVHVFAFECTRLAVGQNVNRQLAVIFTDECDKFKDLTHAHSFAHDFHMRTLQTYITGRQLVFKTGYYLTGFLQDFVKYYQFAPTFSRNFIFEDSITIMNTNSASTQLFDYMLKHDTLYGMRAVKMQPPVDDDSDPDLEYALVTDFKREEDYTMLPENCKTIASEYNCGMVVCHDVPSGPGVRDCDKMILRLKFYVVLTNTKNLFPEGNMEKKLGVFKSAPIKSYPAAGNRCATSRRFQEMEGDVSPGSSVPVSQCLKTRQESVNYLGFTNVRQATEYSYLLHLSDKAGSRIRNMVEQAMAHCRRDILWQRMLVASSVIDEESGGRRKRKSEVDESKDPSLTKLTFQEFQELIDIVKQVPLSHLDPNLAPLQTMNITWYQSLLKVVATKYPEAHRYFASSDNQIQYLVVLNPKHLDMFMMIVVDNLSHTSRLCAVYRESMIDEHHSPNDPNSAANAIQNHIEGFVNSCCYHMWAGLL